MFVKHNSTADTSDYWYTRADPRALGQGHLLPIGRNRELREDSGSQRIILATGTVVWDTIPKLQFLSFCITALFPVTTQHGTIAASGQYPSRSYPRKRKGRHRSRHLGHTHLCERAEIGSALFLPKVWSRRCICTLGDLHQHTRSHQRARCCFRG